MANLTRRGRPSIFNLQRDIDDVLEEFTTPRALRREIERLFGEDLSPNSLWQQMQSLFDDFVTPAPLRRRVSALFEPFGASSPLALGAQRGGSMFVPDVELVERDNEYMLNVDLPGVRQDDVQVSVDDNNILTIRGERREEETRQSRGGYEYSERSYGSFMRSIELPRAVDPQKIEADYRDGVLQLHIPKSEQAMARRQIPIRSREGRELGQGRQMGQQGQQGRETGQQGREMGQQGREVGGEQGRDQPRVMGANAMNEQPRRDTRTQANSR